MQLSMPCSTSQCALHVHHMPPQVCMCAVHRTDLITSRVRLSRPKGNYSKKDEAIIDVRWDYLQPLHPAGLDEKHHTTT